MGRVDKTQENVRRKLSPAVALLLEDEEGESRLSVKAVLQRNRERLIKLGLKDFADHGPIPPRLLREEMTRAAALVSLGVLVEVQVNPHAADSDRIAAARTLLQGGMGFATANLNADGDDAVPSVVLIPQMAPPPTPPDELPTATEDTPRAVRPDPDAVAHVRRLLQGPA